MDGIDEPPSLPAEPPLGGIDEESIDEEEGVELEREEHKGEVEFQPNVDRYIHHLHQHNLLGSGYYDERLHNFHAPVDLANKTLYYAKPRKRECVEQVNETPQDHPLRAIASVLESAADGSVIRVTAHSLTDLLAIDLLSHRGATKTVRVLLHRSIDTHKALVKWVTEVGNKRALLENIEIRLISMTTVGADDNKSSLHAKSVITDTYTVLGSYNLSNLAREGNFEVLTVTPTEQESKDIFD